jgi:small multidrug resistance pump
MTQWIALLVAIVLEVSGTTAMKLSEGFTRLWPSIMLFVFYAGSFVALTFCVRHMQVSVAYAVWSGLGTFLIALIGVLHFKEPLTAVKVASLVMIVVGVIGVNMGGPNH